jgi:hypothetical protein
MRSISLWRKLPLVAIPALAVLLAWPGVVQAQRFTGELSGSVVDESGAVIPGADVALINDASGAARRTVTNSDGFFAFSAVPAATYTVTITLQGFKTQEIKGITLRAGDSRSLRQISMGVATVAETVTVSAEAALTSLDSGERSATLGAEQIENIPIVSSSAAELLRILPGMTPVSGVNNRPNFTGEVIGINGNGEYQGGGGNNQSAIGNFSANGTRTQSLDITLDGAPGADPGCNCATSVNPNTEMVQEFKVLQSNFGADQAKGPNSMVVVTKSGGREYHGSVFTYFRDYHLNSNEWFGNKIGADRVQNKFIYPGFTFSGPLKQDKIFFFVGYEYYKQRLDTGFVKSWVPTEAMRNGDFSQAANLGLTGGFVNKVPTGFDGGIIPSSQFDPAGRALLNVFPLPNADPNATGGFNYVDNLLVDQPNHQALARLDFNLSDNTKMFLRYNLQRETQPFVIGLWWRNGQRQVPYPTSISAANQSDSATLSLTHVFDPTLTSETIFGMTYIDFPNAFTDRSKISRSALGYGYNGAFGESNDQIPSVDPGNWGDNGPLLFNPGGFDPILFATKWQFNFSQNVTKVLGTHTAKLGFYFERITNNQPGSGNSNGFIFLDGNASGGTGNSFANLLLGRGITHYEEQSRNVLHNIAWNRWEAYANDSWKVRPNVTLTLGARFSILGPWTDREGNGLVGWDAPNIVWNAKDSSVPLSVVGNSLSFQPRAGFAWDLKGSGETVLRGGAGIYYYHDAQGPYADLVDIAAGVRRISVDNSAGATLASLEGLGGSVPPAGAAYDITDDKQPKTYSWSLTVNQKLPWSMNVEVGYVGNKSSNQMNFDIANINAIRPDGTRPFPQYGDLNVFRHSAFQNYHGIQALLARQRGNFNFTAAYTFSKALGIRSGIGGNQAVASEYLFPNNYRDVNYGVLSYDRTHVATTSYSWIIPGPTEGLAKALLGGWQVAGISTYVSGAPLPIINNSNFDLQGTLADGRSINSQLINGTPHIRVQPALTCDPASGVPNGYLFNPNCFGAPSPGQNGNYNLPYMKAQSYFNHDLSLFKNFDVGGSKKLQLRASAYNVFNHPIAFPDNGANLTLRFNNGQMTDPNFGKLPDNNKFGRRIIQIAARFTF